MWMALVDDDKSKASIKGGEKIYEDFHLNYSPNRPDWVFEAYEDLKQRIPIDESVEMSSKTNHWFQSKKSICRYHSDK